MTLSTVIGSAKKFSTYIIQKITKPGRKLKVNATLFSKYIQIACIHGETLALQRILTMIRDDENLDREGIEAELHLSIKDYNNCLANELKVNCMIDLEDILKQFGYYDKT